MRRLFLILSLFSAVAAVVLGQEQSDIARLKQIVAGYGQASVSVEYPGFTKASELGRQFSIDRYREGRLVLILSPSTVDRFIGTGMPFTVEDPVDSKGVITSGSLKQALDWQTYPSYTQYDSIMRKFAADYPAICILDTIGTSILGKLVLVLKISDNVREDDEDEPEVFYTSTMHGDELGGFVLLLRLSDYLLGNYASDSQVQNLVNNLQIYINPLANPDGTYRSGNEILNPIRANSNGTDLNRNFPDPAEPGIVPEKENVDMITFMRSRRFSLSANFHAGAEVLNYPWDRWTRFHPDDSWFLRLCRGYADTVHVYAPAAYLNDFSNGVVRGSVWYVINGGRQDFVTWELQGREVTIELDETKQTPADQLETLWQYNYRSLLNYLQFALQGVTGKVRSTSTGEPLVARVWAEGHDADSSHVYSFPGSGYYNRLIDVGTRTFRFSAPGYRDTVINDVVVIAGQKYNLDVFLEPLPDVTDTIRTDKLLIGQNPSDGNFEILLPENNAGEIVVELISMSGRVVWRKILLYSDFVPLPVDAAGLPSGLYIIRARSAATGRVFHNRVIISGRLF